MKLKSIIFAVVAFLSISSCKNGASERIATVSDSLTNHQKAQKLRVEGAPTDEYMPLQLKAVEELRNGTSIDDPVDVLSQTGYFYRRNGDYVNAVKYMQEAQDYIENNPHYDNPKIESKLYGNLANLYIQLDMTDEAIATNAKAIEISRNNGCHLLPDLYLMRAGIFEIAGKYDSLIYYNQRAITVGDSLPPEAFHTNKADVVNEYRQQLAIAYIEHHSCYPDSLDSAIRTLETIDTHRSGMETSRFLIGYGYVLKGNPDKGIPIMEEGLREFERQKWGEGIHWAYKIMIDVYSRLKMSDKAAELYPGYNHLDDSIKSIKRANAAIAADIRYNATLKQERINQLDMQLSMARQRMVMLWIIVLLSVVIVAGVTWYVVDRCKKNRRKRIHLNMRIAELLSSQRQLNSRIDSLMNEINSGTIETAKGVISPSLLKTDEAGKFRRTFEALYPHVMVKLHEKAANLTPNDELLCMLIYLKQTPEEISKCLGITRLSVNSARYRIRTKLNLPKEVDLDQFIRSL